MREDVFSTDTSILTPNIILFQRFSPSFKLQHFALSFIFHPTQNVINFENRCLANNSLGEA